MKSKVLQFFFYYFCISITTIFATSLCWFFTMRHIKKTFIRLVLLSFAENYTGFIVLVQISFCWCVILFFTVHPYLLQQQYGSYDSQNMSLKAQTPTGLLKHPFYKILSLFFCLLNTLQRYHLHERSNTVIFSIAKLITLSC